MTPLPMSPSRRSAQAEAPPVGRVAVTHLKLTSFRCYEAAELALDGRPVVLTGPNGAGKTNLLEALSFLAPGRGLRGSRLSAVDRRGVGTGERNQPWAVAARIATPLGEVVVGTGRESAPGGEDRGDRRVVRIDGVPAKGQAALADLLAMVWLTPQMDRILQEGGSGRRRFLDRLVFAHDPAHAARVLAYDEARRERQRVLEAERGDAARPWLDALEHRMAETGVAVAAARSALVRRLNETGEGSGPFPRAGLALTGAVEAWLSEGPALVAEERFRQALAATRWPAGPPSPGPHGSQLAVLHLDKGIAAELASTGEQKALLISIVLAHARLIAAERGIPPLLLLDEVAAHLDAERRSHLFQAVLALDAQVWMTGTDEMLFRPLAGRAQFFRVRDATVSRHQPDN